MDYSDFVASPANLSSENASLHGHKSVSSCSSLLARIVVNRLNSPHSSLTTTQTTRHGAHCGFFHSVHHVYWFDKKDANDGTPSKDNLYNNFITYYNNCCGHNIKRLNVQARKEICMQTASNKLL